MPYNNYRRRPQQFAEGGVVGAPKGAPTDPKAYRISPIGSWEYKDPSKMGTNILGSVGFGDDKFVALHPDYFDDPENTSHERIHIGQNRLDNSPTVGQVLGAIGQRSHMPWDPEALKRDSDSKRGQFAFEEPAYRFQGYYPQGFPPSNQSSQDYGKYINLLKSLGGGDRGISSIEVSVPPQLEKDYLKTTPVQVTKPAAVEAMKRKMIAQALTQ